MSFEIDGDTQDVTDRTGIAFNAANIDRPTLTEVALNETMSIVPLIQLAWGRSGDKGNNANIGIIARKQEYLPWIWASLTEDVVATRFAHFLEGPVERFLMPGPAAINFVLHDVLGGGGIASLRNDPQGKGYAQVLLDQPIPMPASLVETIS